MTGTEYWSLSEGDLCKITTDLNIFGEPKFHKGDLVEVVYRDHYEETLYFKEKDGGITAVNVAAVLNYMEVHKKRKDTYVTRLKHKFNPGDVFWIMKDNKAKSYTVAVFEFVRTTSGNYIRYYVDPCPDENSIIYTEDIMFASKEDLLKSL